MTQEEVGALVKYLKDSGKGRSFPVIRKATGLLYSDTVFQRLIQERVGVFRACTLYKRDKAGRRVQPGRPGIALIGA